MFIFIKQPIWLLFRNTTKFGCIESRTDSTAFCEYENAFVSSHKPRTNVTRPVLSAFVQYRNSFLLAILTRIYTLKFVPKIAALTILSPCLPALRTPKEPYLALISRPQLPQPPVRCVVAAVLAYSPCCRHTHLALFQY